MQRIVVCGPRSWSDRSALRQMLRRVPRDVAIVHGGARGADSIAGAVASELGFAVEVVPAQWNTCSCGRDCIRRKLNSNPYGYYCKAAGPTRNAAMLALPGVIGVLACVPPAGLTAGTGDTVQQARSVHLPVWACYEVEPYRTYKGGPIHGCATCGRSPLDCLCSVPPALRPATHIDFSYPSALAIEPDATCPRCDAPVQWVYRPSQRYGSFTCQCQPVCERCHHTDCTCCQLFAGMAQNYPDTDNLSGYPA